MFKFNEEKGKMQNEHKSEYEKMSDELRELQKTNNANQGELEELNKFKNEKDTLFKDMDGLK